MAVDHEVDKIVFLLNTCHICRGFIRAAQTKFCLYMTCLLRAHHEKCDVMGGVYIQGGSNSAFCEPVALAD
eukprot:15309537-Ditylum_brightwellii.AAC.1